MSLTLNHLPLEIFAAGEKKGETNTASLANWIINELIATGEIKKGDKVIVSRKDSHNPVRRDGKRKPTILSTRIA